MTHISQDLNRICTGYCPLVDECPEDRECGKRIKIRALIYEIMGVKDNEE